MKTYENDGNVNYDDLSGGDISEVKGYGSCTDGRDWRDCHCSDSEVLRQLNSAIHNINNGANTQININEYNNITQIINRKNIKVNITLSPITQVFSLTLSVLPREFITLNSSREYRVGSGWEYSPGALGGCYSAIKITMHNIDEAKKVKEGLEVSLEKRRAKWGNSIISITLPLLAGINISSSIIGDGLDGIEDQVKKCIETINQKIEKYERGDSVQEEINI